MGNLWRVMRWKKSQEEDHLVTPWGRFTSLFIIPSQVMASNITLDTCVMAQNSRFFFVLQDNLHERCGYKMLNQCAGLWRVSLFVVHPQVVYHNCGYQTASILTTTYTGLQIWKLLCLTDKECRRHSGPRRSNTPQDILQALCLKKTCQQGAAALTPSPKKVPKGGTRSLK